MIGQLGWIAMFMFDCQTHGELMMEPPCGQSPMIWIPG